MSSCIYTAWGDWEVRNSLYWDVFALAIEAAESLAAGPQQLACFFRLKERIDFQARGFDSCSVDVDASDLFPTPEDAAFWSDVLFRVARQACGQAPNIPSDAGELTISAEWEDGTSIRQTIRDATSPAEIVWAADLAVLLSKVARRGHHCGFCHACGQTLAIEVKTS
jgi:hypothetical protein